MMFTALSPRFLLLYLQDHPQQSHGATDDLPLLRKAVDEAWTAIGR